MRTNVFEYDRSITITEIANFDPRKRPERFLDTSKA